MHNQGPGNVSMLAPRSLCNVKFFAYTIDQQSEHIILLGLGARTYKAKFFAINALHHVQGSSIRVFFRVLLDISCLYH